MTSPGLRESAMERHRRIEQTIDGESARLEIDAEIRGQKQIGLSRLDGDAGGDTAAIEIPGAGVDVVLGDNAARRERTRLALDGEDAIDQHQRLVRQTDARGIAVDGGEVGTEDARDGTDGELQTLGAVRAGGVVGWVELARPTGGEVGLASSTHPTAFAPLANTDSNSRPRN